MSPHQVLGYGLEHNSRELETSLSPKILKEYWDYMACSSDAYHVVMLVVRVYPIFRLNARGIDYLSIENFFLRFLSNF